MSSVAEANAAVARFNADVLVWAAKQVPAEVVKLHKAMLRYAELRLLNRTPVKTGHARHNWQAFLNSPPESEAAGGRADAAGVGVIVARNAAVFAELQPFTLAGLANNVEYIEFLEEGSSAQAPAGMVAVVVGELELGFSHILDPIEPLIGLA